MRLCPGSLLLAAALAVAIALPAHAAPLAPVLKWAYGGCISGPYCQTGWYASPAVADLDGDGQAEVIWGAYDLFVLNGANGTVKWKAANGNRVWPGVAVADIDSNGTLEVVVGRSGNQVTVYDRFGNTVWVRNPFDGGEVRTLAVADLESDGQLEIVVGRASGGSTRQLNVYEPNGTVRPGWPARRDGEPGYGWGMYNENVAVADMNGDGYRELFGPTDTHYVTALDRGGNQLPASALYGAGKVWSQVGVHVDHAVDLRGYAYCGTEHRPNFADSAPVVADVDGNGVPEMIVVGNVYNCGTSPYTSLYQMPFLLRLDRTRWSGAGYDWTAIPVPGPGSAPLAEDYNVIETAVPNPVAADLDGDGQLEILFPSYDGKLHAYWLDKTEHGNWPFVVPATGAAGDSFRFASEPVVADLDGDGSAEVLVTSWPKKSPGGVGYLHVLSAQGVPLYHVALPNPDIGAGWNGGLGAPTLANIDADPDLEVVVGTVASGVVAYDLPGTAAARVLWGTGRGSYRRTGADERPSLSIADVVVAEGSSGLSEAVFDLTLSAASQQIVSVDYSTADGSALASSDYATATGTVSFPPGSTSAQLTVDVVGDLLDEANETFFVNLSNASGARVKDGQALATITDDDPLPALAIADASVAEGEQGVAAALFGVTLSVPSGRTVTVNWATADATAAAPADYATSSGTVVFPAGTTARTVGVPVRGDRVYEGDETFLINLSAPANASLADAQGVGTIQDDDPAGLSATDVAVVEPLAGSRVASFTVTLAPASGGSVSVDYAAAAGTATANDDYLPAAGTLTFDPGVTQQAVDVTILADALVEGVESFTLELTGASGAPIAYASATGRIFDPGSFSSLTPCRVFDTREAAGPYGGPALVSGATRVFALAGRCGIPATARAVAVNLTVTQPSTAGNLRLYAADLPLPLVSTLNYRAAQTRGNNAVVGLSPTGTLAVFCSQASGSAHAILDVTGYVE